MPRAVKSCWLCQGFETFTWMGQLTSISNCKLHDLKPSQFYCVGWKNLHATCRFVGVFNTNYSVCIPTASLLYLPVAFIILWMQSLSVRIKVLKISSNINTMNCSSFAGIICTMMLTHTFEFFRFAEDNKLKNTTIVLVLTSRIEKISCFQIF